MKKIKRILALLLAAAMMLAFAACGKDAVTGKWMKNSDADGEVIWEFSGGKCSLTNMEIKKQGTYKIDGDQITIHMDAWSEDKVYTFSVEGDKLTMTDNSGLGIDGTFDKQ